MVVIPHYNNPLCRPMASASPPCHQGGSCLQILTRWTQWVHELLYRGEHDQLPNTAELWVVEERSEVRFRVENQLP